MNGIGAARLRGGDDAIDVEVALRWRIAADADGFAGHAYVPRAAIALGIDGNRRNLQIAARANHPHGDLAAIRDQDLAQSEESLAFAQGETVRLLAPT